MKQEHATNPATADRSVQPQNPRSKFRYQIFAQGLTWLGSLGLLSNGLGLAQTPAADPVPAQSPSAQSVDVNPVPILPPAPDPIPVKPESFPSEFAAPPAVITPPPAAIAPSVRTNTPNRYEAPSLIILNERSTGCRAVLSSGQTVSNSCSGDADTPTAGRGAVPTLRPLAGIGSAVTMGPIAVRSGGLSLGTTPSVQDFYRRTLRPPGQLGNGNISLIFPLTIPAAISSVFGWRIHPISGEARFHTGTDLAAPLGTPVLAAYAGRVALADFLGGYGLAVALDHNNGTQQTLYGHLSEIFVRSGEMVKQGDVIGRVGSTGNSTGPHLHFEFRQMTTEGWVAMDAGEQLEYSLAQLVKSLEFAQASSQSATSNAGAQGVISAVN